MATVDLRECEVRRIGLALNDPKTVIRRGDTYEVSLKRRNDAGHEFDYSERHHGSRVDCGHVDDDSA
jgi:hypothetical protein